MPPEEGRLDIGAPGALMHSYWGPPLPGTESHSLGQPALEMTQPRARFSLETERAVQKEGLCASERGRESGRGESGHSSPGRKGPHKGMMQAGQVTYFAGSSPLQLMVESQLRRGRAG